MKSINQYILESHNFLIKGHTKQQTKKYNIYKLKNKSFIYIRMNSINDLNILYKVVNFRKAIERELSYDRTCVILLTPGTWKKVNIRDFIANYEDTGIEITIDEFNKSKWTELQNKFIKK